jgi:hypothetical protein
MKNLVVSIPVILGALVISGCGGQRGATSPSGKTEGGYDIATTFLKAPDAKTVSSNVVEFEVGVSGVDAKNPSLAMTGFKCRISQTGSSNKQQHPCQGSPLVISGLKDQTSYAVSVAAEFVETATGLLVESKESTFEFHVNLVSGSPESPQTVLTSGGLGHVL